MDPLVFNDLEPAAVPVVLGAHTYTLCEASTDAAAKYKAAQLRGAKTGKGRLQPSYDSIAEANLLILGLCLFDTAGSAVGTDFVRRLPARVTEPLFDRLKLLSPRLLGGDDQESLQKRFTDAAEKLAGLSESSGDRRKWRAWMMQQVAEALASIEDGSTPTDDLYPNSHGATTANSA